MISTEHQTQINDALNKRGYLVVGSYVDRKVGDKIGTFEHFNAMINHPFYVIAKTDEADILEQLRLWNVTQAEIAARRRYQYYYRVKSD